MPQPLMALSWDAGSIETDAWSSAASGHLDDLVSVDELPRQPRFDGDSGIE
jgi:hypothetical protein